MLELEGAIIMKYIISGKNIEVTKALEEAILDKISKLDKFFSEQTEAQITLSVQKQRQILEITIPFNGHILRAEVEDKNMYNIIDDAVAIIEKQITRFKNRLRDRHRNAQVPALSASFMIADEDEEKDDLIKIERTKKFPVKPMSAEEAVLQMEMLGHNFFVYLDADTEEVSVVYSRKNGSYGLIEPILD